MTITLIILLIRISANPTFVESLFHQKLFLIAFGLAFYYVILWSLARNEKSKLKQERLKLAESEAERIEVEKDPKYKFNTRAWLSDQKDEIIVSLMAALLLIEFDEVAVDLINRQLSKPIEPGNWIYLTGGALGDILYRAIKKLRGL